MQQYHNAKNDNSKRSNDLEKIEKLCSNWLQEVQTKQLAKYLVDNGVILRDKDRGDTYG